LPRPLVCEATIDSESVSVLNNEDLSIRLEAEVKVPVSVLNNEDLSENPEDKDRAPERDLNREIRSERIEPEPSELLRPWLRPLT